jgi:hypothetical protein
MKLLFDPTTGELVDETIIDTLPISRKKAILSLVTPNLLFFNADKLITLDNQHVTFSWDVQFAKKVKIIYSQFRQEVSAQGSHALSLLNDAEVRISYESYNGTKFESEIIIIKVYPAPVILFEATELRIENGSTVGINWNIKNAKIVKFSDGIEDTEVLENGELEIKPLIDTVYKLIITALDGTTIFEKAITIQVFDKPLINFFKAEPDVVLDCVPVTLLWNVEHAKRTEIDNGIGEVEACGTKKSLLKKDKTFFTLTAFGELSNCTQEVFVRLFPTPIIESLKVPMPDFSSRFSLGSIILYPPNINLSINIPDFNFDSPQFKTPDVSLNRINPQFKSKLAIFNFLKIYEIIRRKSRT